MAPWDEWYAEFCLQLLFHWFARHRMMQYDLPELQLTPTDKMQRRGIGCPRFFFLLSTGICFRFQDSIFELNCSVRFES